MFPSLPSCLQNDRRSWLSKAQKEVKDPKPSNAQVLTVPIQGKDLPVPNVSMLFIH